MAMEVLSWLIVSACMFVSVSSSEQPHQRPEGISDEMYCMGCEITIKELDLILHHKPTRGMGETVTRALNKVCDLSTFKKYEYSPEKVLKVCQHIVKDDGLEAVLITDYGRKHATGSETSYLEISKKVCGIHLHACQTPITLGNEEGGGITYDAESEEFTIMNGQKVRRAKPVREDVQPEATKPEPTVEGLDILPNKAPDLPKDSHDEL